MTARAIAGTTSGLHHITGITGITGDVQANVDFYVGFLGLKLVKRTAGYADAEQLHLLYGDGLGSPGSLHRRRRAASSGSLVGDSAPDRLRDIAGPRLLGGGLEARK